MPYRQLLLQGRVAFPGIVALAALLVSACGSNTPLLNSERIAAKFGSYGVDVIESNGRRRVSNLYSLAGDERICRTYAVVQFAQSIEPAFAAEHARVLSGQSIGAVFKAAGWTIAKPHIGFGETVLTGSDDDILNLMKIELPQTLATHTYVFEIAKNGQSFDYAVITEMHHPAYLTVNELMSIYGGRTADASAANAY